MMQVSDGQNDFTGGMNDRSAPERLAANEYAYGENLEIRDGSARTRRGTFNYYTFHEGYTLNGSGMYYGPANDQRKETLIQVLGSQVWRMNIPQPPVLMDTPSSTAPGTTCRFVQAFDSIYMLRGADLPIWKWQGRSNTWEVLTAPTAGDPMPNTEYGIYAYNRGWLLIDKDTVIASDIFSEAFDLTLHSWDINSGEGGQAMALHPFADGSILVFKDNSVWLLGGCNGDLTGMYSQIIDSQHGVVSRDAVVKVGNDVWFLSKDGIRSVILTTENNAQLNDIPVSFNIPGLINRINWNMAYKAQAAVIDNYVLFAVPVDSAAENNAMIVYDLLAKKWVGLWTGITAKRFATSLENGVSLFTIDNNGSVEKMLADPFNYHRGTSGLVVKIASGGNMSYLNPSVSDWGFIGVSKSTGIISLKVRIPEQSSGTWCIPFMMYGSDGLGGGDRTLVIGTMPDFENIYIQFKKGASIYWEGWTTTANIQSNSTKTITIVQDGTQPKIYIDGTEHVITWNAASFDKTQWLNKFISVYLIYANPYSASFIEIDDYKITNLTGSSVYFHLPASEGSGAILTDTVSGHTLALTGHTWHGSSAVAISTRLDTRAFSFSSPLPKTISRGLLTVSHRTPSFSVSYRGNETAWTASGLAAKTYDKTKYDIHGVADFANTGARFNEAYRKDYSPLVLPVAGMLVPTAGLRLDQEVEHTEQFGCRLVAPHAQLKIVNTTGTLAVKEIMLQGTARTMSNKGR